MFRKSIFSIALAVILVFSFCLSASAFMAVGTKVTDEFGAVSVNITYYNNSDASVDAKPFVAFYNEDGMMTEIISDSILSLSQGEGVTRSYDGIRDDSFIDAKIFLTTTEGAIVPVYTIFEFNPDLTLIPVAPGAGIEESAIN